MLLFAKFKTSILELTKQNANQQHGEHCYLPCLRCIEPSEFANIQHQTDSKAQKWTCAVNAAQTGTPSTIAGKSYRLASKQ